ncbi:MAG: glutathione-disulfide reductase [Pseudomonadales bacterium]|nr:glutathione-disulfide reductase [Pseudomonadales bacterium]
MSEYDFDLFVIGAGSGGVRASRIAASLGAKVAVAEDRYPGGTCVNVGCVPKKLFVYASHYAEDMHDAAGYGWKVQPPEFDWNTLRDNKNREIDRLQGIYRNLLSNAGAKLIDGRATILGPHKIEVNGETYSAERILIATGGWPFIPEFPGREHVISSNEVFYLDTFPKRALVVGGGYIAVEFAGIFNGLGAETHQLYRGPLFLRGFDTDVQSFVAEELQKKGINLHFNADIERVEKNSDGTLTAHLNNGEQLVVDTILYATGRRPLTENLGLDSVNVTLNDNGTIQADDQFQTSEPSIYAIGDVIGTPALTPVALEQGTTLAKNIYTGTSDTVDYSNIPTAVFCQPNIGTVGLSEQQAREEFGDIDVYRSTFTHMKHTLSGGNEKTLMKILVDKKSDRVVGMHMVGAEAGEIIQGLAAAMKMGITKKVLDSTIGIHPTAAEEFVTMREPV